VVPGGGDQPGRADRPDQRRVVAAPRAQAGADLDQLVLVDPGCDGTRVPQQRVRAAGRDRSVVPSLALGGSDDQFAVGTRHQVDRVSLDGGAHRAAERHRTGTDSKPQDLALHRSHQPVQARVQPARPAAGCDDDDVRFKLPAVEPHAGRFHRLRASG
jgi:hypothetical protein